MFSSLSIFTSSFAFIKKCLHVVYRWLLWIDLSLPTFLILNVYNSSICKTNPLANSLFVI